MCSRRRSTCCAIRAYKLRAVERLTFGVMDFLKYTKHALLSLACLPFFAAPALAAAPSWGAIAARPGGYGYSFDQSSRAAAERVARAQCEGAAGRTTRCEVRVYFERSCAALATGNFGEWGTAVGPDRQAAGQAAVTQCDGHLPTEPCKLAVSVCSSP